MLLALLGSTVNVVLLFGSTPKFHYSHYPSSQTIDHITQGGGRLAESDSCLMVRERSQISICYKGEEGVSLKISEYIGGGDGGHSTDIDIFLLYYNIKYNQRRVQKPVKSGKIGRNLAFQEPYGYFIFAVLC